MNRINDYYGSFTDEEGNIHTLYCEAISTRSSWLGWIYSESINGGFERTLTEEEFKERARMVK